MMAKLPSVIQNKFSFCHLNSRTTVYGNCELLRIMVSQRDYGTQYNSGFLNEDGQISLEGYQFMFTSNDNRKNVC